MSSKMEKKREIHRTTKRHLVLMGFRDMPNNSARIAYLKYLFNHGKDYELYRAGGFKAIKEAIEILEERMIDHILLGGK